MPPPFGPTTPKNSPSATENVTSRSASFRSYATRWSGWTTYSFSRARCSCGIQNDFETPLTSIALPIVTRAPRSAATRGCGARAPSASVPIAIATGTSRVSRSAITPSSGRVRAEQHEPHVLQHLHERVQLGEPLRPLGQDRDRVHDRRREEEQRRGDLPDLADVAEADVQRREDQREAEHERVQLEQQRHEQDPAGLGQHAAGDEEDRDRDAVRERTSSPRRASSRAGSRAAGTRSGGASARSRRSTAASR